MRARNSGQFVSSSLAKAISKTLIVVKPVRGSSKEFITIKKKFLFKMANYLSDLVEKSSIKTIMSIKNGIRITFISMVMAVDK